MFDVRAANEIIISTRKRGSQLLSALQHDAKMVPKRTAKRHETMHGIKLEIVVPNLVRQNVYLNVLPNLVRSQNSIKVIWRTFRYSFWAHILAHSLDTHFGTRYGVIVLGNLSFPTKPLEYSDDPSFAIRPVRTLMAYWWPM